MSGVLTVAAGVATPLALLGLIAALAYFAYARRLSYQEKKLEELPADERAMRTDEYLTRYGIDGKKLKTGDKLALIRDEMEKRHRRSLGFVLIAAVVFVICFAMSVAAYVMANGREPVPAGARKLTGENPAPLLNAPQYLRGRVASFPAMQDAATRIQALSHDKKADGQFFCSDPIDASRTNPTVTVKGIPPCDSERSVEVHVFVPRARPSADIQQLLENVEGSIATLKLSGHAPEGSVIFVAYWVEGDTFEAFDELEVFLE
jgi:hypothetical protein